MQAAIFEAQKIIPQEGMSDCELFATACATGLCIELLIGAIYTYYIIMDMV